jgi:hypothetical protein
MTVREIKTGQDSFLDIVANLVGILIILVVVVGAQAKVAWKPSEPVEDRSAEITELAESLEKKRDQALRLDRDNELLEEEIHKQAVAAIHLNQVRHEMLLQIEIAEQLLAEKKEAQQQKLTDQQQAELALIDQERQLERRLAEINQSLRAVATVSQQKTEIIEHHPNPIAKTVFTEEIHFQIRGGKIVYVPLEELLSRMKSEVRAKVEQLRNSPSVISTVGPIQNFQLQYELIGEIVRQSTPNGVLERTVVHFNGFQLFPSSDDLGVPVAAALDGGERMSDFRRILQRQTPQKTTISLWVYPDSFTQYNAVKHWLYQQGYQVACWPLDADKRISGSPSGFRTSAQ